MDGKRRSQRCLGTACRWNFVLCTVDKIPRADFAAPAANVVGRSLEAFSPVFPTFPFSTLPPHSRARRVSHRLSNSPPPLFSYFSPLRSASLALAISALAISAPAVSPVRVRRSPPDRTRGRLSPPDLLRAPTTEHGLLPRAVVRPRRQPPGPILHVPFYGSSA